MPLLPDQSVPILPQVDQQLLQRGEVVGVGQVVGGQVVDGHLFVLGVGDDHLSLIHI